MEKVWWEGTHHGTQHNGTLKNNTQHNIYAIQNACYVMCSNVDIICWLNDIKLSVVLIAVMLSVIKLTVVKFSVFNLIAVMLLCYV
jgi:hypothetical protein